MNTRLPTTKHKQHGILDASSFTGLHFVSKLKGRVLNLFIRDDSGDRRQYIDFLHKHRPPDCKFGYVHFGKSVKFTPTNLAECGFLSLLQNVCSGPRKDKDEQVESSKAFDEYILDNCGKKYQNKYVNIHVSYLISTTTNPQQFHFDFSTKKILRVIQDDDTMPLICIIPLTVEGAYIEIAECGEDLIEQQETNEIPKQKKHKTKGTITYIPLGFMVVLPATVIHAGGYKSLDSTEGNLRIHCYIIPDLKNKPIGNQVTTASGKKGDVLENLITHHMDEWMLGLCGIFDK